MPSLYESTVNTGEVSSSNFTTLYNASGLSVPNAGAGSVTGNLNVGGNLTVQGNSLLIGDVTLQSTLCLPNYCFPLPDGNTDQVMVTDGNGNLYWTDVSAIPGADYNISATTATGGANLTLANTAGFTDNVKFAAGTNMSIVRTDANTITISTVADNIPDGTANGQVLVWQNSAWTANSVVASNINTNRFVAEYQEAALGSASSVFARKNTLTTPYTTGDGTGFAFQLDSNSQTVNQHALIHATWDAATPNILLATNINNNTAGPFITVANFNSAMATLNGDLTVNGGDISTVPGGIANLYNNNAVDTINIGNSVVTEVNIGNLASGRVYAKTPLFETASNAIVGNNLDVNGDTIKLNATGVAADNFIYFNGTNESLKWDQTNTRFELSDQLYISQTDIPQVLERRVTSATTSPYELRTSQKLLTRVTDAPNNDTVITGPTHLFGRTSGASDPTERIFASMGSSWDGALGSASLAFNWTNDNFSEPTPGNFPGSYNLLVLNSENSRFFNNSIYIDYSAQGTLRTATSITGGNTLVFGSAHGYTVGERIQYTSTTQNGLIQNRYYYVLAAGLTATQCQLGLTSTGSAVALTNGTGLTLVFADLVNQVGINTNSPDYTLDVNGTTNTVGQLSLPSMISNTIDPIFALRSTANTTTPARALTLRAESTGTPTVGFGTILDFEVETSVSNTERAGYIGVQSTDITPGNENFSMGFGLMQNGGTYLEKMNLNSAGDLQIDGDLTVTGQNITTGVTNTSLIADITSTLTTSGALPLYLKATSTGTPAVGFGSALGFIGQTATSNFENAGYVSVNASDLTPGSEDFTMGFGLMQNGATFSDKMLLNSAGDLTIDGAFSATQINIDSRATIDTVALTTTATATVPLLTSTRNAVTGLVNIIQGANVHCVNVTILRVDATTAMLTTYGEMYNTTSLASFTADVSAGSIRLLITPTSATSTVFSAVRTTLT